MKSALDPWGQPRSLLPHRPSFLSAQSSIQSCDFLIDGMNRKGRSGGAGTGKRGALDDTQLSDSGESVFGSL